MKCKVCGNDVPNGAKFCENCGSKMPEVAPQEQEVVTNNSNNQINAEPVANEDTTEKVKFCQNCGEKLDIKAKICSKCGARVEGSTQEQTQQIVNNSDSSDGGLIDLILPIIIGLIGSLIIGLILFWIMGGEAPFWIAVILSTGFLGLILDDPISSAISGGVVGLLTGLLDSSIVGIFYGGIGSSLYGMAFGNHWIIFLIVGAIVAFIVNKFFSGDSVNN